ncbi:hypothetical protein [uncultured Microbacterium sp.]|uniref:hypothetical protein n=1 Tax=uncultured Microbacterium sp. TaxID=191216 RepID=UPI0028DC1E94|nr:hypothetical protein [uncultured Microbacterium sp.]
MLTRAAALVAVLALSLSPLGFRAPSNACNAADIKSGLCGSNDGSSVIITGGRGNPASPGSSTNPRRPTSSVPDGPHYSRPDRNYTVDDCRGVSDLRCSRVAEAEPPSPSAPSSPGTPAITISDVASFAPAPPSAVAEPSNLGVAGRPANFVATASAHTREGSVLGTPVTVRFTPASYTFAYGDGTTTTRPTGGASWTALGQAPFTPTATSHVYDERGTYDTTVTVHYSADIDLGTGWIPLDGSLPVTSPTQPVRIYEAHTALVHHTCIEDPGAPGC